MVERGDIKLVNVTCELDEKEREIPLFPTNHHLLLQVIPKAEGPGIFLKRVIACDTSFGSSVPALKEKEFGEAHVSFGKSELDHVCRLAPTKIFGGVCTVGDFVGG